MKQYTKSVPFCTMSMLSCRTEHAARGYTVAPLPCHCALLKLHATVTNLQHGRKIIL